MAKNRMKTEGSFDRTLREIANHNFSDVSILATQLDLTNVTGTTLQNLSGMVTDALDPGATYKFRIKIPQVNTANNGSKYAFKFGAASMLASIQYNATMKTAAGEANTNGSTATDQALLADNAAAVVISTEIWGTFTLNNTAALQASFAQGLTTLQLQAAEHTSHADTFSVLAGAIMEVERVTTG